MPRQKKERCIGCRPGCVLFKPVWIPADSLEIITLQPDEYEAIRLSDVEGLIMINAAKKMKISASTFCRILAWARQKVAGALITTKGIQICS